MRISKPTSKTATRPKGTRLQSTTNKSSSPPTTTTAKHSANAPSTDNTSSLATVTPEPPLPTTTHMPALSSDQMLSASTPVPDLGNSKPPRDLFPSTPEWASTLHRIVHEVQLQLQQDRATIASLTDTITNLTGLVGSLQNKCQALEEQVSRLTTTVAPVTTRPDTATTAAVPDPPTPMETVEEAKPSPLLLPADKASANSQTILSAPTRSRSQYVYTHISVIVRRNLHAVRHHLRSLQIQTNRILGIHQPVKGVISLLTHVEYKSSLERLLIQGKIAILAFNPSAPSALRDPKHRHLPPEHQSLLARFLHTRNCMRGTAHLPTPIRHSVAYDFLTKGIFTREEYEALLPDEPFIEFPKVQDVLDAIQTDISDSLGD